MDELDKMLKDNEPTDWVNSIVCNVKDLPNGKKVRLCLDPRDLHKNIRRALLHAYNLRNTAEAPWQEVLFCGRHKEIILACRARPRIEHAVYVQHTFRVIQV